MTAPAPRRTITMPAYTVGLAIVTVVALCLLTLAGGVAISNANARKLVARYEADKAASQAANRVVYCDLFRSQLDAFDASKSEVGKQSYQAWLKLYRLVNCQPVR